MYTQIKLPFFILAVFLECMSCRLAGQKMEHMTNDTFPAVSFRVGITPTALLNINSGVQFSGGATFSRRFTLNAETAYLFNTVNKEDSRGYRIRFGPRYNFRIRGNFNYFVEPTFNMWKVNYADEHYFFWNNGQSEGNIKHRVQQTMTGAAIHGGKSWDLGKGFWIEYSSGFGLGRLIVDYKDIPADATENIGLESFFPLLKGFKEGTYTYPFLIFHISAYRVF